MIVARKQTIILTLLKLEKMVYRPELLHRNAPDSPGKETPPRWPKEKSDPGKATA
jgi:hypothetical protein